MKLIYISLLLSLSLFMPCAWAETITLQIGEVNIQAEVASSPKIQGRGLMHRNHLCTNCGMLFVFKKAGLYNFWMKNTPIPLSIAFIGFDGSILNIEEMQPNTTDIHKGEDNTLYALEMNSGWFTKNGVKPGQKIRGLNKLQDTSIHRD